MNGDCIEGYQTQTGKQLEHEPSEKIAPIGDITAPNVDPLLTIADVAAMLRVSPKTIYNWVHRRIIPRIKLGHGLLRFRREDIERWVAAGAKA